MFIRGSSTAGVKSANCVTPERAEVLLHELMALEYIREVGVQGQRFTCTCNWFEAGLQIKGWACVCQVRQCKQGSEGICE